MPDVVPHGGKILRSLSPPASRGEIFHPFGAGVMRTVVLIFATTSLFRVSKQLMQH
jgi:hypothetical protein